MSSDVSINLYNFDDPCYTDSRYILTSPRSLEACHNLQIKPSLLLPQTLDSYFQQLEPLGVAKHHIFAEYDIAESERRQKLQICRDERARLIDEKQKQGSRTASSSSGSVSVRESVSIPSVSEYKSLPHSQPIKSGATFAHRVQKPVRPKSAYGSLSYRNDNGFSSLPAKDKRLIESMVTKRRAETEKAERRNVWEAKVEDAELKGNTTLSTNKYRQLIHRRTQNDLRKRLQKQAFNLDKMQHETAKQSLLVQATKSQKEAAVARSRFSYSAQLQKKLENLEEEECRRLRHLEADRRSAIESEHLEKTINARENVVAQNLNNLRSQKLRKIQERQNEFEHKLRHAQRQKAVVGASVDNWHNELLNYRNEVAKKATKTHKASIIERQQRVRQERESKTRALAENLRRLKLEEDMTKRALEETIRKKEKRTRLIEIDKERYLRQTRSLAQLSEKMRSEIRAKSETFDQKVAKAELEHKLVGAKVQPAELNSNKAMLNHSSVHLG